VSAGINKCAKTGTSPKTRKICVQPKKGTVKKVSLKNRG